MGYRARLFAAVALTCYWLSSARWLHAEPVVLAVQGFYESPQLFAPAVYLVFPDVDGKLRLSQVGWSTRFEGEWRQSLHWSLVGDAEFTPFHAESSNLFYSDGREDDSQDFRDTALSGGWGLALRTGRLRTELRFVAQKHWLAALPASTAQMWNRPYAGADARLSYAGVSADDIYLARFRGLNASAHAQALLGQTPFVLGEAALVYGARAGPVFVLGGTRGVYVSQSNLVSRWLLGGSWDAQVEQALFGHPYAEYRVERAATGFLRLDLEASPGVAFGLRGAAALMPGSPHHGEAALVVIDGAGVVTSVGFGVPDLRFARWTAFASVMAATFL